MFGSISGCGDLPGVAALRPTANTSLVSCLRGFDDRILLSAPAVINYQVGTVAHEHVFVTAYDGNLYLDDWNGSKWTWKNLGNDGQPRGQLFGSDPTGHQLSSRHGHPRERLCPRK